MCLLSSLLEGCCRRCCCWTALSSQEMRDAVAIAVAGQGYRAGVAIAEGISTLYSILGLLAHRELDASVEWCNLTGDTRATR
jgi:hypothetical protein